MSVFSKLKKKIKARKKKFAKKHPKLGKILKKREKLVKKARSKVKGFVKKTVGATLLAPLLPFKGMIKKQLEKKGVSTKKMKFPKMVETFYKKIVKKGKNFEDREDGWLENHYLMNLDINEATEEDHAVGTAIAGVVSAVLSFVKNIKKKKDDAKKKAKEYGVDVDKAVSQVLTPEEQEIAEDTERVVKKLEQKQKDSTPVGMINNKMKGAVKYAIFAVIGILALILIFRKK